MPSAVKNVSRRVSIGFFLASLGAFGCARAADLRSISRIAFGPENVLFVADWKASRITALQLPKVPPAAARPYNVRDLGAQLSETAGGAGVHITDMVARPGTGLVYVAYEYGKGQTPALAEVSVNGMVHRIDLKTAKATQTVLEDATTSDHKFWGVPQRSFTVTDMKWHGNELFVAGLSNETFASTLWRKHYPFDGKRSISSIEMFHTTHNQIETRAPIRAMAFAEIDDKPTLIAAYLCTPLVTIPLDALVDGAHVRGKTIAELGYGNSPSSMIMYDRADGNGKTEPTLLITNYERSADLIPLTAVSAANAKPGLDKFVPFGNVEGIQPGEMPFAGFVRVDNLDGRFLIALRNNIETGKTQLVTFDKSINLRVTDFLTEYDFADYRYPPGFQSEVIKPIEDTLLRQEGVPSPNKP